MALRLRGKAEAIVTDGLQSYRAAMRELGNQDRRESLLGRHWQWHADEVYVKINGETHYLWRAVEHAGEVLESYVTKTRDKKAALRFLKKALKRHDRAEKIVTDGLGSYPAAMKDLGNLNRREMGGT